MKRELIITILLLIILVPVLAYRMTEPPQQSPYKLTVHMTRSLFEYDTLSVARYDSAEARVIVSQHLILNRTYLELSGPRAEALGLITITVGTNHYEFVGDKIQKEIEVPANSIKLIVEVFPPDGYSLDIDHSLYHNLVVYRAEGNSLYIHPWSFSGDLYLEVCYRTDVSNFSSTSPRINSGDCP